MTVVTYADAWKELRFRNRLPWLIIAAGILGILLTVLTASVAAGAFVLAPVIGAATVIGFIVATVRRARFVCPDCGGYYLQTDWLYTQRSIKKCCHCGFEARKHADSLQPVRYSRRRELPPPMPGSAATAILRRVGIALIVIGLLDIAGMIYAIAHQISYSSSLNIFAVILGIFVLRGSLRAANFTVLAATFLATGFVGVILLVPVIVSSSLLLVELRTNFHGFIWATAFALLAWGFLLWVVRELTGAPVRMAQEAAGITRPRLRWAVLAGCVPLAIAFVGAYAKSHNFIARHAVALARDQVGPDYDFQVTRLSVHSAEGTTSYLVVVVAWNDTEIKEIPVSWSQ